MKKIILRCLVLLVLISPGITFAQADAGVAELKYTPFVQCDGVPARLHDRTGADIGPRPGDEKRDVKCDLGILIGTVVKLIYWGFYISVPVTVALFSYAGVLYMTGTTKNITTAKKIFTSVGIGFAIMCVGWLGVKVIVDWFVRPSEASWVTTFIK